MPRQLYLQPHGPLVTQAVPSATEDRGTNAQMRAVGLPAGSHANAEAVLLTAARMEQSAAIKAAQETSPVAALGIAAFAQAPFAARKDQEKGVPDVPLTAVQAAQEAIPKGPPPAHVPLMGYEPKDEPPPADADPEATPWREALRVIRST